MTPATPIIDQPYRFLFPLRAANIHSLVGGGPHKVKLIYLNMRDLFENGRTTENCQWYSH